jgi:hypothetical protein
VSIALRRRARVDHTPRARESHRIRRPVERVDADAPAARRRVNETLRVEGDAHMQIFALQMHEHEITRLQIASPHGHARVLLLLRRARQVDAGTARGIYDQPAAIESPGLRSTVLVGLPEHCGRVGDEQRGVIDHGRRRGRRRARRGRRLHGGRGARRLQRAAAEHPHEYRGKESSSQVVASPRSR